MYTNLSTALIWNKHLTTKNVFSEALPGVLRPYDLPDLPRALGDKLVVRETL